MQVIQNKSLEKTENQALKYHNAQIQYRSFFQVLKVCDFEPKHLQPRIYPESIGVR